MFLTNFNSACYLFDHRYVNPPFLQQNFLHVHRYKGANLTPSKRRSTINHLVQAVWTDLFGATDVDLVNEIHHYLESQGEYAEQWGSAISPQV